MRPPASSSRTVLVVAGVAILLHLAGLASAQAQVAAPRAAAPTVAVHLVDAAVAEASRRYGVPEHWIRAVMRQESNGDVRAVSSAGAMGLMQVMPGTYAELRARYGLGADPFAIRDNILAGTAYLREMHDRYGGLGMLAAYNAGPGRWEEYRAGVRPLPRETIGYLARLGPVLDLGTLPAASIDASPARPSPLAAPLFVALAGPSATSSDAPIEPSPRVVLASNTPPPASSDSLFVRRSSRDTAIPEPPSAVQPSGIQRANEPPPNAATGRVEPPANPLFPSRSGSGQR